MASTKEPVIVIDLGSSRCKTGIAGEANPRSIQPSIIGRTRNREITFIAQKECYVGDEAIHISGILNLHYPIRYGMITDWGLLEKLLRFVIYNELCMEPADCRLLLTDVPESKKADRERTVQTAFESFRVPALYLAMKPVLPLLSAGRTEGLVLSLGDTVTHAAPVSEGYLVYGATQSIHIAGNDLTEYMAKLLVSRGYRLTSHGEKMIVRDIKEKAGIVKDEEDGLFQSSKCGYSYELPDGQVLVLGKERFMCTEPLFNPRLIGMNVDSIDYAVLKALMGCDLEFRSKLSDSIVLAGGTSMFPGLAERLGARLEDIIRRKVKVVEMPDRGCAAWIGGSVLGSLSSFGSMCVDKSEYEEAGPGVVHRKCY